MVVLENVNIKLSERDAIDEIKAVLEERKDEYEGSLIPDLSYINHRAENHTGIEIEDISFISGSTYQLDYKYDWNVYNGCSDMDGWGVENAAVIIEVTDNGSTIEINGPEVDERTTRDEF